MSFTRATVVGTAGHHLIVDTYSGKVAPFGTSTQRDMALIELREVGMHRADVQWAPSPIVLADTNELQAALDRLQGTLSHFDIRQSESDFTLQLWCDQCPDDELCDIEDDDTMSALTSIAVGHWLDRHEGAES